MLLLKGIRDRCSVWDADMATRVAYAGDMELGKCLLSKWRTPKTHRLQQRDRWMRAAWALVEEHEDVMRIGAALSHVAGVSGSERGTP